MDELLLKINVIRQGSRNIFVDVYKNMLVAFLLHQILHQFIDIVFLHYLGRV